MQADFMNPFLTCLTMRVTGSIASRTMAYAGAQWSYGPLFAVVPILHFGKSAQ